MSMVLWFNFIFLLVRVPGELTKLYSEGLFFFFVTLDCINTNKENESFSAEYYIFDNLFF